MRNLFSSSYVKSFYRGIKTFLITTFKILYAILSLHMAHLAILLLIGEFKGVKLDYVSTTPKTVETIRTSFIMAAAIAGTILLTKFLRKKHLKRIRRS